jgi:exonuclease SbcD
MRFLHTADLHLDRTLFETRLLDDQAYVLDQIVGVARERAVDCLVIAGDVFDRAQVRGEAVRLLSDFLRRIHDLNVQIVMTPGNHDAPDRIGFASDLLDVAGLHVCGSLRQGLRSVRLEDIHGPLDVHLIPYADPAEGREYFADLGIQDHDALMRACIADRIAPDIEVRQVVVGHCFVAQGAESESERPLAVGGAGHVARDAFAGADLVMLGHLHRPQPMYSGSILPFSFDEAEDTKSVVIVDLGAPGDAPERERVALSPRRRMRVVEGYMADLETGRHGTGDDYVLARLSDTDPVLDAMARLRAVWPNLLHVERADRVAAPGSQAQPRRQDLDPYALFTAFWQAMTDEQNLPDGGAADLVDVIQAARAGEREETPE